ncbi:PREDICTED: peroxisomal acyl-coenzyme A oxidase 2 isoform X2 [Propithecus coquereli]|uniref:peroxisomal acyl-coenzyme A oxidase 2 isoform X2 n=1 Tax=Propithecus coquereli TaxID=379532 RepID=UPI00063F61C2|nr:PREDICTED: peroxisomal acyl-coenzyme A oxidase 2 isoform X2 [Propithecus coquereli]
MSSPVHRVSLGDTWSGQVHPDIDSERRTQSFEVERLTNILDGGAQNTARRRKVESIIHNDPEFSYKDNYFMTQNELYEAAMRKTFHIRMLTQSLGWSEEEVIYAYRSLSGDTVLGLNTVFLKALRSLGSEEQIAKWEPLCKTCQVIVTYAQTELGHGITVGDIGPKMSFNQLDNGFLRLDHVRVPRENMLNRFARVLPDGTYIKLGTEQSNYLSMVVTRVEILLGEILPLLQKACVIATRYSVIRRQSRLRPSDPEAKILDYQTQQHRLFPQLAMSYAFHFLAVSILEFFRRSYNAILDRDFSLLPELHALSTGAKAMIADFCIQGAEMCCRACGGHGYSKLSGLPSLVTRVSASSYYEGENTVLYLQVARFLVKSYRQAQVSPGSTSQRSLPSSVAYLTAPDLSRCPAQRAADFLCPELYTTAWAHVATRLIKDSVHHLQTLMQSGADQHEAWNQTTVILLQAAKAHCYYTSVKSFSEALQKLENEPAIQQVLKRLCHLHALHGILTNSGDFLHDGFLSGAQVDMVRTAYLDLFLPIRKDAILLTDAFDFTDRCLNSALGCYDGNVYERLFQWAQKSPINTQGNPAYEKYIRPLVQSQRSKL